MDRKNFIATAGIGVGALALAPSSCLCCLQDKTSNPPTTPCEKKQQFAERWAKRFFDVIDSQLDEATRRKLLEANGKACHQNSLHGEKITPMPLEVFVKKAQEYAGKENCRQEGNVVYFNYSHNPAGLKIADGYCLCPMVESGPPGLSPTFCFCSVGYVRDMFETATGRKAEVELLASLKRGDKTCSFKVTMV